MLALFIYNRYIYCSVLTAEKASDVEHFHHKKLAEDYMIEQGVPFIALRPGTFLDCIPGYAQSVKDSDLETDPDPAFRNCIPPTRPCSSLPPFVFSRRFS